MCGISIPVHEKFARLDELNRASREALREIEWSQKQPVEAELEEVVARHRSIRGEIDRRRRRAGAKSRSSFNDSSSQELRAELAVSRARMDELTNYLREGRLSNGRQLKRPRCNLPEFVGVLVTGFEGSWITQGGCLTCRETSKTARCCWCQCGICEAHGRLIARASRRDGAGASTACCRDAGGCLGRQRQILAWWKQQTGEELGPQLG